MKFTAILALVAGAYRVNALAGIGAPLCLAACTPLLINPIAYAACAAGCSALAVSDADETHGTPVFMPDGTVVFEKESPKCAEACRPLAGELLTYSACLSGCAAVSGEKN